MTIELLTPAKINLGLEVIGKRADGYHDIATVFQTISIFDRLRLSAADEDEVRILERIDQIESNLAHRALELARNAGLTSRNWHIEIRKRIPVAGGLGGASADAAGVLLALASRAEVDARMLRDTALAIGSDVPFLLKGGAALAHGRGEVLSTLPPLRGPWIVLACPEIELERKTAQLYGALAPGDFSDGTRSKRVAAALQTFSPPREPDLVNAFDRAISELIPDVATLRKNFAQAGAPFVALSGAGPTHYTFVPNLHQAIDLARALEESLPMRARISVARPIASGPVLHVSKTPAFGKTL